MIKIKMVLVVFVTTVTFILGADSNIPKDVIDKLDKIGQEMTQATLTGDYSTLLKYYTDDVILMPNFIPQISGIKALREIYTKNKNSGIDYHAFSGTVDERWQSDGLIYERGTFGMTLSTENDKKPKGYYGSYFQIWEKSNSDYKIKFSIWNLDHSPF